MLLELEMRHLQYIIYKRRWKNENINCIWKSKSYKMYCWMDSNRIGGNMDMINIFQNLGLPVAFLLITIYAVKALYNEMLEDKKRHEIMLTERLELVTKTNMEISSTNKMLVEEISKNLNNLNKEVEKTNLILNNMLNKKNS